MERYGCTFVLDRSSIRFGEVLQIGLIPVYVYSDFIWLRSCDGTVSTKHFNASNGYRTGEFMRKNESVARTFHSTTQSGRQIIDLTVWPRLMLNG
jgi:hypothetical protein